VCIATTIARAAGGGATGTIAVRALRVDAASNVGTLRSLQGVNGAPGPGNHKPPHFTFGGWNVPERIDASAGYRRARIDLVRTHDAYGPGDIDAHFGLEHPAASEVDARRSALDMFPNLAADPDDPRSYRFAATDRLIGSIERIGAQPLFRLGRSETSTVTPPADPERYASIVEHVVRHYNGGWARGFHYGIRYWEVWNEPDLGRLFWGGTPSQFYSLYALLARAIKRADPQALVGAPALAAPHDTSPYREGFLRYVRAHGVPLDFFSWHWYATDSQDPLDFVRIAREVRARLDAYGFTSTLSVLDEWNYGLDYPLPADLQRAAFIASAVIYMQDAPLDLAALYRADNLFSEDGATPDKSGWALTALGRMRDTPVRLAASGGDLDGLAVLAGRSQDGRRLQVLIANYEIPGRYRGTRSGRDVISVPGAFEVALLPRRSPRYAANAGYELEIEHLPPAGGYRVERYRIAAHENLTLVEERRGRGERLTMRASLPPPGIDLIVVKITD